MADPNPVPGFPINQATHSYPPTMLPIVGFTLLGGVILLLIGRPRHARKTAAAA